MARDPALTKNELAFLKQRAEIGQRIILDTALWPNRKKDEPTLSANRVASLFNRPPQTIGRMLKELGLETNTNTQRYDVTQETLGALAKRLREPSRRAGDGARVVAVVNQKGGVAKTTTVVHLAHWLALRSYRVLVIDLDAQASCTAYCGLNPDAEVEVEHTAYPVLVGDKPNFEGLIRTASHIRNLDFVPACLGMSAANEVGYSRQIGVSLERDLAKKHGFKATEDHYLFFVQLANALAHHRKDYDVILLDCPPHISLTSYNGAYAADVMIVPFGASMLDFASTLRFVEWLDDMDHTFEATGHPMTFDRIRFLLTNYDNSAATNEVFSIVNKILGEYLLPTTAKHSAEIQRAAITLKSIYEIPKPIGSREAWSRACQSMDEVNQALLEAIRPKNEIEQVAADAVAA